MNGIRQRLVRGLAPHARPGLWVRSAALLALVAVIGHPQHREDGRFGAWVHWALMVAAMMLPALAPLVCRIAGSGLWNRRRRSVAEFTAGYLCTWLAVGVPAVLAVDVLLSPGNGERLVVAVLTVAAIWHVTPPRRRLLRRCGSLQPIPLHGLAASMGCLRAGWSTGWRSMAACGPAMAAMLFVPSPVLMVALGGLLWSEQRRGPNPAERLAHPMQAVALLALALAVLRVSQV